MKGSPSNDVMAYQTMPHDSTGFSQFQMLYGRETTTSTEVDQWEFVEKNSYEAAVEEHAAKMQKLIAEARSKGEWVQEKRAAKWNSKPGVLPCDHFQVGDLVWFDQRRQEKHPRRSLQRWVGPMKIILVSPGPNYLVRGVGAALGEEWSCVHPQFLKLFHGEMELIKIREDEANSPEGKKGAL
ncbi:hypothetical protein DSO57_1039678 [Entomophthora muscae]|uniref:Uncharacterized protein n=1 Tax=Entomophthora muscae TaxID=34485 RepID=A0ACC2SQF5_9FUNG|nr:hypothetical protein DSO57_1039678 [Entomophthora muscae]